MPKRYDIIIGIDPDVELSGWAYLESDTRKVSLRNLAFPDLIDNLILMKNFEVMVVVEAGWLVSKSNYHGGYGGIGEKIAKNTGSNHEVGKLILEMCRHYGLNCMEQYPLNKGWKGSKGKISHEEIAYFIPDFPSSSNQETRDAALLAWNYAGFPIRVKPSTVLRKTKINPT